MGLEDSLTKLCGLFTNINCCIYFDLTLGSRHVHWNLVHPIYLEGIITKKKKKKAKTTKKTKSQGVQQAGGNVASKSVDDDVSRHAWGNYPRRLNVSCGVEQGLLSEKYLRAEPEEILATQLVARGFPEDYAIC